MDNIFDYQNLVSLPFSLFWFFALEIKILTFPSGLNIENFKKRKNNEHIKSNKTA